MERMKQFLSRVRLHADESARGVLRGCAGFYYHLPGTPFWEEKKPCPRVQDAHLTILRVDVLIIPLHNRAVDEQAPHDNNHLQNLSQGHLSKHGYMHVKAHIQHANHTELGWRAKAETTIYLS